MDLAEVSREGSYRGTRGSTSSRDRGMWRSMLCRSLGVLLLGVGTGVAVAGEDPPPLSPPSLTPPVITSTPANDAPPDLAPPTEFSMPPPLENRPMLVIPGVNAPIRV